MSKYIKADSKGNLSKANHRKNLERAFVQSGGWSKLVDMAKGKDPDSLKIFQWLAKELIDKNIPKEVINTTDISDKLLNYFSNTPKKLNKEDILLELESNEEEEKV